MSHSRVISIMEHVNPAGDGPDGPLFTETALRDLAAVPSVEQELMAVVRDAEARARDRFVAAEALLEGHWTDWRATAGNRTAVAVALAEEITRDRVHNRWGLPEQFVGPFGKRLASLGPEAKDALRPLLHDESELSIIGSEAATIQSQARYRIADLARWLISRIP